MVNTKKAQGLSMQTIVILVLAIVVLAATLMFFFGGFGKSGSSLNDQQALATCQSRCTRAKAIAAGCESSSSSGCSVSTIGSNSNYCTAVTVEGSDKKCNMLMTCAVTYSNGQSSTITC